MKYLLVAAMLSLGFSSACLADTNTLDAKGYVYTDVKAQYPNAAELLPYKCQTEGHRQVCNTVKPM